MPQDSAIPMKGGSLKRFSLQGGMFLILTPMESLKSLDEYPARQRALIEAMGKEKYEQLMSGAGAVFNSIDFAVFEIKPRMSYVSKETEDGDPDFWRPKAPAKPGN